MRTSHAAASVVAITVFVWVIAPTNAPADCPYAWKPGDGLPGLNGEVRALIYWDPDGPGPETSILVAGGNFTIAGNVLASNIAAWDGTTWRSLGDGVNAPVYGLAVYDGQLIAC